MFAMTNPIARPVRNMMKVPGGTVPGNRHPTISLLAELRYRNRRRSVAAAWARLQRLRTTDFVHITTFCYNAKSGRYQLISDGSQGRFRCVNPPGALPP